VARHLEVWASESQRCQDTAVLYVNNPKEPDVDDSENVKLVTRRKTKISNKIGKTIGLDT